MREELTAAWRTEAEEGGGDWTILEDRLPPEAQDPWLLDLDDQVAEEHRFQYPAGLP